MFCLYNIIIIIIINNNNNDHQHNSLPNALDLYIILNIFMYNLTLHNLIIIRWGQLIYFVLLYIYKLVKVHIYVHACINQ